MERTIRKEWGMEEMGIIPSARAGNKPVILREGKLGSENLAFRGMSGWGYAPCIRAGLKLTTWERASLGPRGSYSLSPVGKNPVPLGITLGRRGSGAVES